MNKAKNLKNKVKYTPIVPKRMRDWFDTLGKKLAVVGGIIAFVSSIFGGFFWMENHYALSAELNKTKARLEYKIKSDQLQSIQDRVWKLEDRFHGKAMPDSVKEEYRKLQEQLKSLQGVVTDMEKKGIE